MIFCFSFSSFDLSFELAASDAAGDAAAVDRIPAVVAWLLVHAEQCVQSAGCPLCALSSFR